MQSRQAPDHSVIPTSSIKGAPRISDPMVTIYNKDGEPVQVNRDNLRDHIQHLGYTLKPVSAETTVEDDEGSEIAEKKAKLSPKMVVEELPDTAKEIIALRNKLDAAAVKVDARWGLKKLREVVAELDVSLTTSGGGGDQS